jgi:hypothetical protein
MKTGLPHVTSEACGTKKYAIIIRRCMQISRAVWAEAFLLQDVSPIGGRLQLLSLLIHQDN